MKFGVVCFARSGQLIFITDKKIKNGSQDLILAFFYGKIYSKGDF